MRLLHISIKLPLLFILLCLILSCTTQAAQTAAHVPGDSGGSAATEDPSPGSNGYAEAETVITEKIKDNALRRTAARIAAALDDRQLAAQVIISGIDGRGQLTQSMRTLLAEYPAGGIMLFKYNLDIDNDAVRDLTAGVAALITSGAAVELSASGKAGSRKAVISIPPFVAADHEGGAINRFRRGVADLPTAASYWRTARDGSRDTVIEQITVDSYNAGKAIYRLGVNMNFAPVAEPLSGGNEFLRERSFGPDPGFAADAANAFITGMKQAGILCVVKHFPGHGGADPHHYSSMLSGDRPALAEITAPFELLINKGSMRAIMVAHTAVPAWDRAHIASLSPAIMDGWLRRQLGFEGLIICDDFAMVAAKNPASELPAVIQALIAGADMVLVWPNDLRQTHEAIRSALNNGRLPRERLRDAASRIIFEKLRMGLVKKGDA